MLDISLSAIKHKVIEDLDKKKEAYEKLNQLREHDEQLKALYAKRGIKKPEILA